MKNKKMTLEQAIKKAYDKYMTLQTEEAYIENGANFVAVVPSGFILSHPQYYTDGFIKRLYYIAKFLSKYTNKIVQYGQGYTLK